MRKKFAAWLLIFCFLMAFPLGAAEKADKKSQESLFKYLKVFSEAIHYIKENYVKDVSYKDLIYDAIKGMTSGLDPHSVFLTPDMFKEMQIETTGEFGGVGMVVTMKDGVLTVVSPIEDTPAWKAGIKAGDKIIKIDGAPTKGMTLMEAVKKLRGPKGTKVTITIVREGVDKPFDVTIVRDIIKIKSVTYKFVDEKAGIGYIKIKQFQEKTTDELEKAFNALYSKGMKALILDLRNDPGGLLVQAVSVADKFLPGGRLIVYTKGKGATENLKYVSHDRGTFPYLPMVVLVNAGSASASEIVTGALKAHKRAIVIGEKTFGKGSVQTIFPLSDGSALKLTTAYYYTPDHICIEEKGITPDIVIPENLVAKKEHPVIREKELVELKKGKSLEKKEGEEKKEDYQLRFATDFLKLWLRLGLSPNVSQKAN
ncbi:S41 family peptidase [Thermosulfidibacter takaii]|nr:S41 family peptidase [Thermosulfidibacter takaii]